MKTFLVVTLTIALLSGLLISQMHVFSASSPTSEADPITIIRAFAEDPELELIPETDTTELPGTNEQTFTTLDKSATFTVDMDYHQVVSAIMSPSDNVQQSNSQITADVAYQTALSFATSKIPSFQELQFDEQSVTYHEETISTYFYTWSERLGSEQARGLEHVAITVDAQTGEVKRFRHAPAIPVTIDVEPSITREEATAIAEKEFAAPTIEVETSLSVWWKDNDRTQKQILRWTIELESSESLTHADEGPYFIPKRAAYIIDAHTGEVLETLN